MLSMCRDDARTALRRIRERGRAEGASLLRTVDEVCIRGKMAPEMRGLPGYEEVVRDYEEARRLSQAAVDSVAATSPGGDAQSVRARWEARPKRCQNTLDWDAALGIKREASWSNPSRIGGNQPIAPGSLAFGMFSQNSAPRESSPYIGPDDHLVRLACGYDVGGVDPSAARRPRPWDGALPDGDPRWLFTRALQKGMADPARATLYRLSLGFHCYDATAWKVPAFYRAYLHCDEANDKTVPTPEEVGAAAEAVFPGRSWEKANLVFAAQRALEARKRVDAAFLEAEARSPRMKALFRDSADAARREHAEFLVRYEAELRTLAPMTAEALRPGAHEQMPADCAETLLTLRSRLEAELQPKDAEGVRFLRGGHSLGFQLTEALAACYLVRGDVARAELESMSLLKSSRRVTEEEKVFYARLDAQMQARRDLPTQEQRQQAIPNWESLEELPQVPLTQSASSALITQVRGMEASTLLIGSVESMPAVVVSKRESPEGVWITVKKFTNSYRELECQDTRELLHFSVVGRTLKPVFRQECRNVGPVKKQTLQAQPVLLSKEEASLVKQGMQLEVLVTSNEPADSVLVNLWKKQGKKEALVVDGIRLR